MSTILELKVQTGKYFLFFDLSLFYIFFIYLSYVYNKIDVIDGSTYYLFLTIYPSIYLTFHLSIISFIHLSIYLSFHPSIFPSIYLSIYLSFHPSILSFHLSIYHSIYLLFRMRCLEQIFETGGNRLYQNCSVQEIIHKNLLKS